MKHKSWKPIVFINSRSNHHSLTQHAKVGSCLRAVIGRLEYLGKKNKQRCVYESHAAFIVGCNAAQKKKGMKEYSESQYKNEIAFCRELNIITHTKAGTRIRCLVNFEGCDRAAEWREGWIVTPHEFMTHEHHGACHFVGFGNAPAFPFKPTSGPRIWVPEYGAVLPTQNEPDTNMRLACDEHETNMRLTCDWHGNEHGNEHGDFFEPSGNT